DAVSDDISPLLSGWNFDPHSVNVRTIIAEDGSEKIQMRLELGVLQLELSGRPDGQRIEGAESWLDYFQERQKQHDSAHPDDAPFRLEPEDCENLLREGIQYYTAISACGIWVGM